MPNAKEKQQKKKKGRSTQELMGIKTFTKYGLETNKGELLFYLVSPTNISVPVSYTHLEQYPVEFVYAGQDIAVEEIQVNDGEAIENGLIYGNIKGLKIDRETEEPIAGALCGLFKSDETAFTEETARCVEETAINNSN